MKWSALNLRLFFYVMTTFVGFVGAAHSGCGLAFLPGTNPAAPTINGEIAAGEWDDASAVTSGDPCLNDLLDGTDVSDLNDRNVTFYTKRRSSNFYIAIAVDDQTEPGPLGERIIVFLDADNSRDAAPQTGDYRLEITYFRSSSGSTAKQWYQGNGSAWVSLGSPPGVIDIEMQNTPSGFPGYHVEIRIPFGEIGYSLGDGDLGMAVAVINDMNLTVSASPFFVLSGVAFPASGSLPLNNSSDAINISDPSSPWNNPSNWGEAVTSGAGQMIFMSHHPKSWKSEDIATGFTNATDPVPLLNEGARRSDNPQWYQYRASDPCAVRIWAKVRRNGALVGDEERRVLLLWGDHGINGREWNYVHLTEPIILAENPGAPAGTEVHIITPVFQWCDITPGLTVGHPCLKAFVLPAKLKDGDAAFFETIGTSGNNDWETTVKPRVVDAYGLAPDDQAQMNILVKHDVICPECLPMEDAPCPPCSDSGSLNIGPMLAATNLSGIQIAQAQAKRTKPEGHESPGHKFNDAIVDIEAYGLLAPSDKKRNYTYVEFLGGVQHIINLKYLQKRELVRIPFKLSNSGDYPRTILLRTTHLTPPEITGYGVSVDQPKGIFKPGETRVITNIVRAKAAVLEPTDGICAKFRRRDNASLGAGFLLIGICSLAVRRKR